MHENEVMRAFKTVNDAYIEPISFIVPRRAEVFQGDIYPPALGSKPGLSADAWFGGKDAFPPKIDLEKIYEGGEVVEVPQTAVPSKASTSTPAPTPAKTKEPDSPKKTEIAPIVGAAAVGAPLAAQRGPPPAMKDQKSSISTMADKFQDHESDEESSDDGSSFEEIPKPVERSSIPAAAAAVMSVPSMAAKPAQRPIETSRELPTSPTKSTATAPSTSTTTTATRPTDPLKFPVQKSFSATAAAATRPPSDGGGGSSSSVVASSLQQITRLLEQQNAVISAQSEKIGLLTAEMDSLKTRVGDGGKSSGAKDERIRMLELELEQSRS
jgi:coronin-1B/1C/6